jgi:endonuclease III
MGTDPRIDRVMPVLGRAVARMEIPAVEKISEDSKNDAFQVLVSTMLSAQTKDAVTHAASMRLFAVAKTPAAIAALTIPRIEKLIYPVSFYRNKAVHLKAACRKLLAEFGGRVPETMASLLTLPGVGRKTANLVLLVAHQSPDNICVDTHVHRICNRLGWVKTRTPEQTEMALYRVAKKKWWPKVNLYLVTWGQNVCKPVYPRCRACAISAYCPRLGVKKEGKA